MSARKLGRLVGLVFVLAAAFGGVGVASYAVAHDAGGLRTIATAIQKTSLEVVWS
jgi:hypothetical protein